MVCSDAIVVCVGQGLVGSSGGGDGKSLQFIVYTMINEYMFCRFTLVGFVAMLSHVTPCRQEYTLGAVR